MSDSSIPAFDSRAAERVLELLRQFGWEGAVERMREEIRTATDPQHRADLELLAGWVSAERGKYDEARALFDAAGVRPDLKAWAMVGHAFVAYGQRDYDRAWRSIESAEQCWTDDKILRAALDHAQGVLHYAQGRSELALDRLYDALGGFGLDHFGTGRVLDSLGMAYAARHDFANAELFYDRAEQLKTRFADRAGLALTYGQLGRLYLDWHNLHRAEEYFRKDLRLCETIHDRRGEALMHDHLARVFLARADLASNARDHAANARDYASVSVRMNEAGGWKVAEAFARKDRGRAFVLLGSLDAAEEDLERAATTFREIASAEGLAHVRQAQAQLRRAQDRHAEAEELLRQATRAFDDASEPAEAARAYLDLGRLRREGKGTVGLPREALFAALERADFCRRDALVDAIERELATVDEVALYNRFYRRARGRGIHDDVGVMERASGEKATVLFLDLRDSTVFVMRHDPAIVRVTLNQLFFELNAVLEHRRVVINQYLGDGFMALAREDGHAHDAVEGALEVLAALERFNRPRRFLEQRVLEARIGISTGDVVFGNIGTSQKVDFTGVGPTTNHAARLQGKALPGMVCVSQSTYEAVKGRFEFAQDEGREVELAGVGTVRVWDVRGRKTS